MISPGSSYAFGSARPLQRASPISIPLPLLNVILIRLMPHFQYTAIDAQGQHTTGIVQAGSEAEATSFLRSQNLYPTKIVKRGRDSQGAAGKKAATKARRRSKPRGAKAGLTVIACGLILLVGALFIQNLSNEARASEEATRAEISEQQRLTEDREEQARQSEGLLIESEK